MPYPFRYVLLVAVTAVLWAAWGLGSSRAQIVDQASSTRSPGTVTNVFGSLDPDQPLDGLRIRVPGEWAFESVRLLRYGTKRVPVSVRDTDEPGTLLVEGERPLAQPHDLVLRVRLPGTPGTFEWELHTLLRDGEEADTLSAPAFRTVERHVHSVTIEPRSASNPSNRALSLEEAAEPLILRADAVPPLGRTSPFTIEFWFRTDGLDEVILSTWNGREEVAYPAEFIVDEGGRLRYYTGRPGEHQALRTGEPVANGQWHHVAAVHDAPRSRLRLLLDGRAVDSLQRPVLPAVAGSQSLAVGGRLDQGRAPDAAPIRLFTGHLDELRIWGEARSSAAVRRTMSRPLPGPAADEESPRLLRLGFDEDAPDVVQREGTGIRRVPATLSFRSKLRNLRAESEDRTVTLRWTADTSDLDGFAVERSANGQTFEPVAEVSPSAANRTTGSGASAFSYTEDEVPGQVVFYRIRLHGVDGGERTSGTIKIGLGSDEDRPAARLLGNFPNPFSDMTTVAYEVNERSPVTITVFDVQAHEITTLVDGPKRPGYHEVTFEASDLPSGTYFVRLKTPTNEQSDGMVLLK